MRRKLRILTWHIHGSYLYYLTHAHCDFFLPVDHERHHGYSGTSGPFPWSNNVHEIPVKEVAHTPFDVILFQSRQNYLEDQFTILSEQQRRLPKVYLEHDPPREHPTDTKHVVYNKDDVLVVHVTDFNKLMWDNGNTPTTVIDHGVVVPSDIQYRGTKPKGIVVINTIASRGRRLGYDIFETIRKDVPLDIVGMDTKDIGGIGEVPHDKLPSFIADYRFFFTPIRYTSLGLSICEAMLLGMPIVGLATTELVTVIKNGTNGYIETDPQQLIPHMRRLLKDTSLAPRLGENAKKTAQKRFSIKRFCQDWERTFTELTENVNSSLTSIQYTKALSL